MTGGSRPPDFCWGLGPRFGRSRVKYWLWRVGIVVPQRPDLDGLWASIEGFLKPELLGESGYKYFFILLITIIISSYFSFRTVNFKTRKGWKE